VRVRFGHALCDALRELAAAVLPAFLVPGLELEEAAAGAAAAALAWLEPRALPDDADDLRRHFSERLKAYRAAVAAVVGSMALADRVPLMVAGSWSPDGADREPLMVGIGPERAKGLAAIGLTTVAGLLAATPEAIEQRMSNLTVRQIEEWQRQAHALVEEAAVSDSRRDCGRCR
jgi:predicted flap endonuclease-1-like 5' DNA nuclease